MSRPVTAILGMPFRFGGIEHTGWLPPGAAKPLPTPIEDVVLDLEIQQESGGFLLIWSSRDGLYCGDLWFQTLSDAKAQAKEEFGIEEERWPATGE